ncbi:flavin reductase family protein [Pseudomonas sp. LRF_L74]|uniref:flavin reductase family protein n=1 Tax=Pseudomonas sp. LRF_L74 TaxID=3369422 RepID=UPI003F5E0E9F
MLLDFRTLNPAQSYRWLSSTVTPRPIAWVSSRSAAGIDNLAPFSFFQVISDDPATLLINIGSRADGSHKDTLANVLATGELVVNLVAYRHAEAMNASAAQLPADVSEFSACSIPTIASQLVKPPRVAGVPVAFECRVADVQPYPKDRPSSHHLVFAEVLLAHIDDAVLDERGYVVPAKLDLVGRLSGSAYSRTGDTFDMVRPR